LFIAVSEINIEVFRFFLENKVGLPDITLKNKNGETLKEFIERYTGGNTEHSLKSLK